MRIRMTSADNSFSPNQQRAKIPGKRQRTFSQINGKSPILELIYPLVNSQCVESEKKISAAASEAKSTENTSPTGASVKVPADGGKLNAMEENILDAMEENILETVAVDFYSKKSDESGGLVALLYGLSGPLKGLSCPLASDSIQIGRSPKSGIPLTSRAVSSCHCRILRGEDGAFYIVDEGSTNGTYVNGRELTAEQKLQLTHGDCIAVCESLFLYLNPQQAAETDIVEDIEIDFQSATDEANQMFDQCRHFASLRRKGS